jgi:hypothetical protein
MNEQTTTNPLHAAIADLSGEVIALVRPCEDVREVEEAAAGVGACDASKTWGGDQGSSHAVRTWQHDETGRITQTAECPGPRWTEVPSGVALGEGGHQ